MKEVKELMSAVTKKLSETGEYNQYHILLERVKAQPELYRRIGEFKRRNMALQLSEQASSVHANNELQKDFRDLQNNGLANDFLAAEHQYCTMVRELQEQFLEDVDVETGFLEE